jgi:hypothetical protein
MRRALLALVVLACALAIPPRSASARVVGQVYLPACRAIHGPVFCTALDHRRTIRALRIRQRAEMVRTHARVHIGHRLSTWDVDKLARMNRYERRVLKHLEAKPSYPTLIERAATDEALAIRIAADRYGLSYWGMRRVGGCESTGDATGHDLNRLARNGWYLGLFQEGPSVRDSYLRGAWDNALENALAAARTVVADGNWGQWSCGWAYY